MIGVLVLSVCGLRVVTLAALGAQSVTVADARVVRIAVQGESTLTTNFIDTFKREAKAVGLEVQLVERRHADLDYVVLLAQESTIGSAAAALIAVDRDGNIAASVVRSGRLSGRGAVNACTKELAKKLAVLRR
jgi:hypothetical protein